MFPVKVEGKKARLLGRFAKQSAYDIQHLIDGMDAAIAVAWWVRSRVYS